MTTKEIFTQDQIASINRLIDAKLNELTRFEDKTPIKPTTRNKFIHEIRDRFYLESYFLNNMNCRRTALAIGVPKSTFHDWYKKHIFLIETEIKQRCL